MRPMCVVCTTVGPRALEQTDAALARFWALHDRIPEVVCLQTGIAVAEIVANIVEHGRHPRLGRQAERIEIWVAVRADHVRVVVADDGAAADVDVKIVGLPDDVLAERGRGLAMAKRLCDELTYERRDGWNHWTMTSKPFPSIPR